MGGGGAHGRGNAAARGTRRRPRVGYSYVHVAIDDHSRLAYVEALDDETADTLCGFFERARIWFRSIGVAIDEVISDNGPNFRSKKFAAQLAARSIDHNFTRPYRPQTNGKAERFNRTLADEFLYNHKFRSEPDRQRRLQTWTHHYNPPPPPHRHRRHTRLTRPQPLWDLHLAAYNGFKVTSSNPLLDIALKLEEVALADDAACTPTWTSTPASSTSRWASPPRCSPCSSPSAAPAAG